MFKKFVLLAAMAAAVALAPATEARADARDVVAGAIVGGLVVYGLTQAQRPQTTGPVATTTGTRATPVRPGIPATEQGRETQTALNYFGFDAGAVDGQVGPGTRAAIERYQAVMGYPIDGADFTDEQFDFLMAAHDWATEEGGAEMTGLSGVALLVAYRDTYAPSPEPLAPIQSGTTPMPAPAPTVVIPAPVPVQAPAAEQSSTDAANDAADPTLPTFVVSQ